MQNQDLNNPGDQRDAGQGSAPKLSAEDQARVEKYLQSPVHSVERKPFKPWLMMASLVAVIVSLSLLSLLISSFVLE